MVITEGKAKISVGESGKVTRRMPVFYNPAMKLNRDVSVLLLKSIRGNRLKIADPLAASGVRSIRFLLELNKSKVNKVLANDASAAAAMNIKNNLKLNKLSKKAVVANEEANIFLLKNKPFDYIDIDPFGTPVGFLDAAVKSISSGGILAVTATDTAALAGTAPKACLRKYWAVPLKNYLMHEMGLRILIRRVQLAAASNRKALTPVYSYSKLHYMRVFFRCSNKIRDVDDILKNHNYVSYCSNCLTTAITAANFNKNNFNKDNSNNNCSNCRNKKIVVAGPMWTGNLWDWKIAELIYKNNNTGSNDKFLKTINEESKLGTLGFYDTQIFSEKFKVKAPKVDMVIAALRKKGFKASRTHFSGGGVRTGVTSLFFAKLMRRQ